jgi:hypothetical protein
VRSLSVHEELDLKEYGGVIKWGIQCDRTCAPIEQVLHVRRDPDCYHCEQPPVYLHEIDENKLKDLLSTLDKRIKPTVVLYWLNGRWGRPSWLTVCVRVHLQSTRTVDTHAIDWTSGCRPDASITRFIR